MNLDVIVPNFAVNKMDMTSVKNGYDILVPYCSKSNIVCFFVNKMVFWFMTDDDFSFDIPRWSSFVFVVFVQSYGFKFIMMTEWTYLPDITDNYSSWLVLIHPLPIKLRRAALKLLGSNGPIWKSCWLGNLALKCLHISGDNFSLINPWMKRERC